MNRIKHLFSSRVLNYAMWICIIIWLIIQIAAVLAVYDIPQTGDAERYQLLAEESLSNGSWYPMRQHILTNYPYEDHPLYICYPGLVNLLEIYLRIFGTIKAAFWFNILFNCITLWCIYKICNRLRGDVVGKIAVILYCMFPYMALGVGETMSEGPAIAFTYFSIYLTSHRRYGGIIASAILMVLAQYIRTVAILFAIPLIIFMIIDRYDYKLIITYLATATIACLTLYAFNRNISGYGFMTSTTLGHNMIMGSFDDSYGGYIINKNLNDKVGKDITGKNVFEIDSIMKDYSYKWIKENPGKWTSLIIPKLKYELYYISYENLGRLDYNPVFDKDKVYLKPLKLYWLWFPALYQYVIYILALTGVWIRRKTILGVDGLILLPFLGSLLLTIFTVGHPRYNVPYMPILIYFASNALLYIINRLKTSYKIRP